MGHFRCLLSCWLVALLGFATDARARPGEHESDEQVYRHGVRCMDVIERDDCAVRYFEDLVDRNPRDRILVGDAILRLVKLYQRQDREDDVKALLRRFWDVGMTRKTHGVVPYSTRFLPSEFSTLIYLDIERSAQAKVFTKLPKDARDRVFTCDERRREEIRDARRRREAQRSASTNNAEATTTSAAKKPGHRDRDDKARIEPVFEDGLCLLARALQQDDLRSWRHVVSGMLHDAPEQSAAAIGMARLDEIMAAAQASTRVTKVGDKRWRIVGATYANRPLEVASLDRDELVLGTDKMIDRIMLASKKRKRSLSPELQTLMGDVPRDVAFFTVMTKQAMLDQFAQFGSVANVFLPTPEGLMVSAIAYDYAGLFVRIPTSNPAKTKVLVAVVRRLLEGTERDNTDATAEFSPRDMDVSSTDGGTAFMLSLVLNRQQVEHLLLN